MKMHYYLKMLKGISFNGFGSSWSISQLEVLGLHCSYTEKHRVHGELLQKELQKSTQILDPLQAVSPKRQLKSKVLSQSFSQYSQPGLLPPKK